MERRIFVSGIGFDITENELRTHFEKFGPMTEFKLLRDKNGDSRGLAFISFQKEVSLFKCMNEISHRIGERALSVSACEEQLQPSNIPSKRLYISLLNLPNISEDIIKSWFTDCGKVHSLAFSEDEPKSYCIVTFTTEDAVEQCLRKLYTIKGKPLFMRKAIRREEVKKADQLERERAARAERLERNPEYQYMARQSQPAQFYSTMPSLLGSASLPVSQPPVPSSRISDGQTAYSRYNEEHRNAMYAGDQSQYRSNTARGNEQSNNLSNYGYF